VKKNITTNPNPTPPSTAQAIPPMPPENLKPFFSFYGGKWRIAPKYPAPQQDTIIEPFAGSAGFSLRYPHKQVLLYDIDPKICAVWDYLITAKESEILALPLLQESDHIDDFDLPNEAKWLIGFNIGMGSSHPRKRPSPFALVKKSWSEKKKNRIASQQKFIRHWKIKNQPYWEISDIEAHWFIDPPYNNKAGSCYRHSDIDYPHLSKWCQNRSGVAVVCENTGADWLPFEHFTDAKRTGNFYSKKGAYSKEAIWTQGI